MGQDYNHVIDRIVDSPVMYAIVKLFKDNPYVMDNLEGLALWVARPRDLLEKEVQEMVELGIIHRWGSEPGAIYAFSRDQDLRRALEDRWPEISRIANGVRRKEPEAPGEESDAAE